MGYETLERRAQAQTAPDESRADPLSPEEFYKQALSRRGIDPKDTTPEQIQGLIGRISDIEYSLDLEQVDDMEKANLPAALAQMEKLGSPRQAIMTALDEYASARGIRDVTMGVAQKLEQMLISFYEGFQDGRYSQTIKRFMGDEQGNISVYYCPFSIEKPKIPRSQYSDKIEYKITHESGKLDIRVQRYRIKDPDEFSRSEKKNFGQFGENPPVYDDPSEIFHISVVQKVPSFFDLFRKKESWKKYVIKVSMDGTYNRPNMDLTQFINWYHSNSDGSSPNEKTNTFALKKLFSVLDSELNRIKKDCETFQKD